MICFLTIFSDYNLAVSAMEKTFQQSSEEVKQFYGPKYVGKCKYGWKNLAYFAYVRLLKTRMLHMYGYYWKLECYIHIAVENRMLHMHVWLLETRMLHMYSC